MGWTGTHFYKNIKTVADKKRSKGIYDKGFNNGYSQCMKDV